MLTQEDCKRIPPDAHQLSVRITAAFEDDPKADEADNHYESLHESKDGCRSRHVQNSVPQKVLQPQLANALPGLLGVRAGDGGHFFVDADGALPLLA